MKKKSVKTYETPKFMMKLAAIGGAALMMAACGEPESNEPALSGEITLGTEPATSASNEPDILGGIDVAPLEEETYVELEGDVVVDPDYYEETESYVELEGEAIVDPDYYEETQN